MEPFSTAVRQELATLQTQMAQVCAQMTPLQQTLEQLQAQANILSAYVALTEPSPRTAPVAPGTVVDRIAAVLRRAGTPLHYREILQRLAQDGAPMPGKDPEANLTARLSQWPQFVRVAPGTYRLDEAAVPAAGQRARVRQG